MKIRYISSDYIRFEDLQDGQFIYSGAFVISEQNIRVSKFSEDQNWDGEFTYKGGRKYPIIDNQIMWEQGKRDCDDNFLSQPAIDHISECFRTFKLKAFYE